MRVLLMLAALLSTSSASAAPVSLVTTSGEGFKLSTDGKLTLVGSAKNEIAKQVGEEEMRSIEGRALRLVWAIRRSGKCTPYATVEASGEKASICTESLSTAGAAFGLLQKVRSKF